MDNRFFGGGKNPNKNGLNFKKLIIFCQIVKLTSRIWELMVDEPFIEKWLYL